MKVYEKRMEGVTHYYLSESRFFKSIMELITCYEHASLSENFVGYVAVYYIVLWSWHHIWLLSYMQICIMVPLISHYSMLSCIIAREIG